MDTETNNSVKNNNTMSNLVVFKTISMFVKELGNFYGKMFKNVNLYMHLIDRTTFSHDLAIQKHVDAFKTFCSENVESILASDYKTLKKKTVKYSKKVYINFQLIFEKTDSVDTRKTIWKYLQVISLNLLPEFKEELKNRLLQNRNTNPPPSESTSSSSDTSGDGSTGQMNEEIFLQDIIQKIESNVNVTDTSNPMEAVTGIMQSGLFTDMMTGMNSGFKNGTLDMKNMPGAIQKIISKLTPPTGSKNKSQFSKMTSTMDSMFGMFSNSSSDGNPIPDMSSIMSMLMPQMANMMSGDDDDDDDDDRQINTRKNSRSSSTRLSIE